MAIFKVTKEQLVRLGLTMVGNWTEESLECTCYNTKKNRLRDFFYASPRTLREIYCDIQHQDLGELKVNNPTPKDFLAAFYFLKKYPTKASQAAITGYTKKYALVKAWKYIQAIQALKEKKIRWIVGEDVECEDFFLCMVDGVHCRIQEPRMQPSAGWYSSKFNKAGLAYEVSVSLYQDKIVWVSGPFPAGQNDLRIFRKSDGLMSKIPEGKVAIADKGYIGEPDKVATSNEFDSVDVRVFKRRARARQESINSKLKSFNILNSVFRTNGNQRLEKHQAAFEACLVIVQYELDNSSRKLMKV